MKMKTPTMVIIVLILTAGLMSCSEKSNSQLEFIFDDSGSYLGFESLPSEYTMESAEKDGLIIFSVFGVIENERIWDKFVKNAGLGKDSDVRMAYFSDESDYPYIIDLFYREGAYYLFDSSADSLQKQPYKFLLTLEGQFGIPLRDSGVVILSDDNSLTFDVVMKSMLSSDMNFIESISNYRFIMYLLDGSRL